MGKKNIRFIPDEEERIHAEEEAEHEAELQAVMALRAEREREATEQNNNNDNNNSNSNNNKPVNNYNREGLLAALENLETRTLPFVQSMQVGEFSLVLENELDDIERETAFYTHALQAAKSGYEMLQALKVPCIRPNDYFCEQVKSDAHMTRIKDRLLLEEKKMDAFEKRKSREQQRVFNKQLSEVKKQQRTQGEQKVYKDVEKLRKGQHKGGEDTEAKLEKILKSHDQRGDRDAPEKSKKRKNMDKKYGINGKERKRAKLNDKKSLNDMSDFNPRGGKFVRRGVAGAGGRRRGGDAGKKKPNRPGKESRSKARASRKS